MEELERDFLAPGVTLVPNRETAIVIHKTQRPRPMPPDDERCFARVWNRGKGGRCSRRMCDGSEYCTQHATVRTNGDVRNPIPKGKYPKHKKAMYI